MLKADKEQVVAELIERLRTRRDAARRGLPRPDDAADRRRAHAAARGRRAVLGREEHADAPRGRGRGRRRAARRCSRARPRSRSSSRTATWSRPRRCWPTSRATTRVLAIRGGVMEGRAITEDDVEELATLPPVDVLRGQVLGAIIAPLTAIMGLVTAPLQNLHGLIDARIEQLGGEARRRGAAAEPRARQRRPRPPRRSPQRPRSRRQKQKPRPRRRRRPRKRTRAPARTKLPRRQRRRKVDGSQVWTRSSTSSAR